MHTGTDTEFLGTVRQAQSPQALKVIAHAHLLAKASAMTSFAGLSALENLRSSIHLNLKKCQGISAKKIG
jgi:hypothetical protein